MELVKKSRESANSIQIQGNREEMRIETHQIDESRRCCIRPWLVGLLISLLLIAVLVGVLLYLFLPQAKQGSQEMVTRSPTALGSVTHGTAGTSTAIPTHTDCQALYRSGYNTSDVYTISPDGVTQMTVYCEQGVDGGGWTVFQRRQNGQVNFYRSWSLYKHGFGEPDNEYWLGNDNIHLLTAGRGMKLKVEMVHPDTRVVYADYSLFYIDDESDKYRLHVADFLSDDPPGDAMTYHNGHAFSTFDVDNTINSEEDCATLYKGGWWYGTCHQTNLNGLYGSMEYGEGITWKTFTEAYTSLTAVKMMVKQHQ